MTMAIVIFKAIRIRKIQPFVARFFFEREQNNGWRALSDSKAFVEIHHRYVRIVLFWREIH